ncbi:hypothetical protein DM790_25820 [Flavobacterium collinsii]|nr:hypothetical protein [Flavobacterium collinsii]
MKRTLLLLVFPILNFAQTQIGSDIHTRVASEFSGKCVSISDDGSVIAVGAPGNTVNSIGCTRIYKISNGIWTKIGSDLFGETPSDQNGTSVALSGDGTTVVIGAPGNLGNFDRSYPSGTVRVYKNILGNWTKIGNNINGEQPMGATGFSVAISHDGNIIAVGAPSNYNNGQNAGQVRVLKFFQGNWIQIGDYIGGKNPSDNSAWSISLSKDGNILAIGAPHNDDTGTDTGQVRVFNNINGVWTQIGTDINGLNSNEFIGANVVLSNDGQILAISGRFSNIVRVFRNIDGSWYQMGSEVIYQPEVEYIGGRNISLSGDGNVLAIGCTEKFGSVSQGKIGVYRFSGTEWVKIGNDILGGADKDGNGWSISLSSDGSLIGSGSPFNSKFGTNSGQVRIFSLAQMLNSDEYILSKFILYPNPSSNEIFVQLQENLILEKVNIYNALGQLVKTEKDKVISVRSLSAGNYFVEILTDSGRAIRKIIVQ